MDVDVSQPRMRWGNGEERSARNGHATGMESTYWLGNGLYLFITN
jgi:hypothetical protein